MIWWSGFWLATRRWREHRTADIGEIEFALAVRDQHPMRAQEIGAQHHLPELGRDRHAAAGLSVARIEIGEADVGIPDDLVADGEALEGADPGIG